MAEYLTTLLHPDEVSEGADYESELSAPVKEHIAFPVNDNDKFGNIVQLENGYLAYIPSPGTTPVICEAANIIQLIYAIKECIDDGLLVLSDIDLAELYSRAFDALYEGD